MKKVFILFCVIATPGMALGECTATTTYTSCNPGYRYNSLLKSCALCQQGYYKAGTGTAACSRCPSPDGVVYGTTDSTGSTSKTDCFIPADTDISDTTGTYQFTGDCYYTL